MRRRAPADCCSTLRPAPEELAEVCWCSPQRRASASDLIGFTRTQFAGTGEDRSRGSETHGNAFSLLKKAPCCVFGPSTDADLYCFESPPREHIRLLSRSSDLVTFPSLLTFSVFAPFALCISNDPLVLRQRLSARIFPSRAGTRWSWIARWPFPPLHNPFA